MERLRRRRFLLLLLTLLALLVVYPLLRAAGGAQLLFDAIYSLVFLAAFLVVFSSRRSQVIALLLGIPTAVGAWTQYVLPGLPRAPWAVGFHLAAALFLAFAVATILRSIYSDENITSDSIYGAFSGYLLVGLAFGHLYCIAETIIPGCFHGQQHFVAQLSDQEHQRVLLTYFSFITLTTVGYGDITPMNEIVGGLAVVEAVLGQFYIAVLIAELIGKRVSHTHAH